MASQSEHNEVRGKHAAPKHAQPRSAQSTARLNTTDVRRAETNASATARANAHTAVRATADAPKAGGAATARARAAAAQPGGNATAGARRAAGNSAAVAAKTAGNSAAVRARAATNAPKAGGAATAGANAHAAVRARADAAPAGASRSVRSPKQKKTGSILWKVVFWVALLVFLVAAGILGFYAYSYWHQQNEYDQIAQEAHGEINDASDIMLGHSNIHWDRLWEINAECVAWIYMPNSVIDYPVCHTTNDTKYLTTSYNGVYDAVTYGTIFLEAQAKGDFSDQNNILFGHNMANGGMFATVTRLSNPDEFEAHRTVYLMTPNGNYKLRSFAIVHAEATEVSLLQPSFANEVVFHAFVQDKIDRSAVRPADCPQASNINKIVGLLTCDSGANDAGRWILYCYVEESDIDGDLEAVAGDSTAFDKEFMDSAEESE